MTDILATILEYKQEWVAARQAAVPLAALQAQVRDAAPCRGFHDSVRKAIDNGQPAIIAEIKHASPSKGVIREDFDPASLARTYTEAGAAGLSVLTDEKFFQGSDQHLQQASAVTGLPILRKDFIIDPYQVYEARAIGADCILLIVAALDDARLRELSASAVDVGLDVLVEVHNREELERGLLLRTPLIGINNRDLHTFETSLQTTLGLLPDMFPDRTVVTESGIHSRADIELMRSHDVHTFLIGEALLKADDPGAALRALLAQNALSVEEQQPDNEQRQNGIKHQPDKLLAPVDLNMSAEPGPY